MLDNTVQQACEVFMNRLTTIISDGFSLCLYGSAVMGDFHLGISDIDLLVLTDAPIEEGQAAELLDLREQIADKTGFAACRNFEGGIL